MKAVTLITSTIIASLAWADTNRIYWTDFDALSIQRAALDGTGFETVASRGFDVIDPLDIKLDPIARKVYWPEAFTRKIRRANLDGRQSATRLKRVP